MSASGMGIRRRKSVHPDEDRPTGASGALLNGLNPADEESVRGLMDLLGVREWDGGGAPAIELRGEGAEPARPGEWPRISIGSAGQFRIPEDGALLAEVLLRTSSTPSVQAASSEGMPAGDAPSAGSRSTGRRQSPGRPRKPVRPLSESGPEVIAVAEWTPGSGGPLLAGLLAAGRGSALIDASGSAPSPLLLETPDIAGIRWSDLDRAERAFGPDLVERLPRAKGVRILSGDASGVADGADPRLPGVVEACGRRCVLDLGRWDSRAHAAALVGVDYLVLVGGSDLAGSSALACALSLHPPIAPFALVTRGRPAPRLAGAADAPRMRLSAAMRRGGRGLMKELRRASGRRWAREREAGAGA